MIYPSLIFGAKGAIPDSANVAPAICAEIFNAFERGDHEASKAAQLRLNPVRLSLTLATPPGGVKAALTLLGKSIGPCRSPIGGLSAEKQEKMKVKLAEAGVNF